MYLEYTSGKSSKYYEIIRGPKGNEVYIRFGSLSWNTIQLPHGTLQLHYFTSKEKAKDYIKKKIEEKKKKKYKVINTRETKYMKWMRKNTKWKKILHK